MSAANKADRAVQREIKAFVKLAWAIIMSEGWTYAEIHNCGGPTPQTISKLLNLETKSPHHGTLVKIGYALGIKINWDAPKHRDILPFKKAA